MNGMIMLGHLASIMASNPIFDGQAVTTASLLVSSGLLIWFTKMSIKLRDQLVNSMSEIANSVVDKFVTSTVSSSSASTMIDSTSASDSLTQEASSLKGVAAQVGLDGDGGDDGGGGDGADGSDGSDGSGFDGIDGEGHGIYNDYGVSGDEGITTTNSDRANSLGRKGNLQFAATGSGTLEGGHMSEETARKLGEHAMDANSLASMTGDGLPAGYLEAQLAAEEARKKQAEEEAKKAAEAGKDGQGTEGKGTEGKGTEGGVLLAKPTEAGEDVDGVGYATANSESYGDEGVDPQHAAKADATGLQAEHENAGRMFLGIDANGNAVYSDPSASANAYNPYQKQLEQKKDNAFAKATMGDMSMSNVNSKNPESMLPPDVRNKDAIMNASASADAGQLDIAPYDASMKAGEVGAQYATDARMGNLSADAKQAAEAAYKNVKLAGGTDADAHRAAVAEGARVQAVEKGFDAQSADRIAAAAVAYDDVRTAGGTDVQAQQAAAGAASYVQSIQDGKSGAEAYQDAGGTIAYTGAMQNGATQNQAVVAAEGASAFARAEQLGAPPEKAQQAAAGAMARMEAIQGGATEAQADAARVSAVAYTSSLQGGAAPSEAVANANAAGAYSLAMSSGASAPVAKLSGDAAKLYTQYLSAGATHEEASKATVDAMVRGGVSNVEAQGAVGNAASFVQSSQVAQGGMSTSRGGTASVEAQINSSALGGAAGNALSIGGSSSSNSEGSNTAVSSPAVTAGLNAAFSGSVYAKGGDGGTGTGIGGNGLGGTGTGGNGFSAANSAADAARISMGGYMPGRSEGGGSPATATPSGTPAWSFMPGGDPATKDAAKYGTLTAGLVNLSSTGGTMTAGTVLNGGDKKNTKKPGTPGAPGTPGSKPTPGVSPDKSGPTPSAYMKDVLMDTEQGFARNFPHGSAGGEDTGGDTGTYRNTI